MHLLQLMLVGDTQLLGDLLDIAGTLVSSAIVRIVTQIIHCRFCVLLLRLLNFSAGFLFFTVRE